MPVEQPRATSRNVTSGRDTPSTLNRIVRRTARGNILDMSDARDASPRANHLTLNSIQSGGHSKHANKTSTAADFGITTSNSTTMRPLEPRRDPICKLPPTTAGKKSITSETATGKLSEKSLLSSGM